MKIFKKKIIFKTENIYLLLFIKLLFALVLLLITQWLFYILNKNFFDIASVKECFSIIWGSIVFAVSATLFLQTPFIILNLLPFNFRYKKWYQNIGNFFFVVSTLLAIVVNIIDIVYYRFTYRRMTADILQYLSVGGDFKDLIPAFLKDYWMYLLIFIGLCFLMAWLVGCIALTEKKSNARFQYLKNTCISILIAGLCFVGMRGISYKPLRVINAAKYATAGNIPLVVNTPASIIFTINNKGLNPINYFQSAKELEKVFTPVNTPYLADGDEFNMHPSTNVVIIILESFSAEYMGCFNGGKESFTPFLDSLAGHSLTFRGMANGKRSIEAIPAVLSGLPSIMNEAYITSNYSGNKITSLAEILKKYHYHSAFFHGAYNGSMGFDSYARLAGFQEYYGKTEYHNDKDADGTWGIFDEPFLKFMANKLNTFPQPFLATVFTISSHHPYKLPEGFEGKFKKGKLPILEVVMYTDHALKSFFEIASKQEWYSNTLFVITADHTAQPMDPFYKNTYGMYHVPMIFYKPNSEQKGYSDKIVQQADILPSVIDYLKLNEKTLAFGRSAFNPDYETFFVSFANGYYRLVKDGYLMIFNEEVTEVYDVKNDPMLRSNLKDKEFQKKGELETFLKAIIQQYNNRLIENELLP